MGACDYLQHTRVLLKKPGVVLAWDCEEELAASLESFFKDVEDVTVQVNKRYRDDKELRDMDIEQKQLLIARDQNIKMRWHLMQVKDYLRKPWFIRWMYPRPELDEFY